MPRHARLLPWPGAFAIWTLIAFMFAMSSSAMYALKGESFPFTQVLFWSATEWYLWALIAPGIFWLDRRFPLARATWRRSLPVHLVAWMIVVVAHETLYVALERGAGMSVNPPAAFGHHVLLYVSKRAAFDLLVYAALVGASCFGNIYRRYRERELRASQLEALLSQAQLDALRNQLQPHFLFNTLNTISSLIHSDAQAADRVVSRLGDLLRLSLAHTGQHELTLREELEFLGHYVEIQRSRFRERLSVTLDVPVETLDARVPAFVLQPLVENAVRHGIEPRQESGRVEVRARRDGDRLRLEVADNGPGLVDPAAVGNGNGRGIGLANTRARLTQLYGSSQAISVSNRDDSGVVVRIEIPWRTAEGGQGGQGGHGGQDG
jgi:signal transduction histidine kinase